MDWLRDEEKPVRQPTVIRVPDLENQDVGVTKKTSRYNTSNTNLKVAECWVEQSQPDGYNPATSDDSTYG